MTSKKDKQQAARAQRILGQADQRQRGRSGTRLTRADARDLLREYGIGADVAAEASDGRADHGPGFAGWGLPGGKEIR